MGGVKIFTAKDTKDTKKTRLALFTIYLHAIATNSFRLIHMRTIAWVLLVTAGLACAKPRTLNLMLTPGTVQDMTISLPILKIQIIDDRGNPMPGAIIRVKLASARIVTRSGRETDTNGIAIFDDLQPGHYEITCVMDGYMTRVFKDIKLGSHERKQMRVKLPD